MLVVTFAAVVDPALLGPMWMMTVKVAASKECHGSMRHGLEDDM
jgi:hypothetical protein